MTIKREQQKIDPTPEEKAHNEAIRKQFQAEKPGPDQLTASGEYERVLAGVFWEVRRIAAAIKTERERQGLTLAQLSGRCGVDKGAISTLETGKQVNPTIDTLSRIASGLGMRLGISLATEEGRPANGQIGVRPVTQKRAGK